MVDSVFESRVQVATRALLKNQYPEELSTVILGDRNLPAWKEAEASARAMLKELQLEKMFQDMQSARDAQQKAQHDLMQAEHTAQLLRENLERIRNDVEKEVERRVQQDLANIEEDYDQRAVSWENTVDEAEDKILNYKYGLKAQSKLRQRGALRYEELRMLEDEFCDMDYRDLGEELW